MEGFNEHERIQELVELVVEKLFTVCLLSGPDAEVEFKKGRKAIEKIAQSFVDMSSPTMDLDNAIRQLIEQRLPDAKIIDNFPTLYSIVEQMIDQGISGINKIPEKKAVFPGHIILAGEQIEDPGEATGRLSSIAPLNPGKERQLSGLLGSSNITIRKNQNGSYQVLDIILTQNNQAPLNLDTDKQIEIGQLINENSASLNEAITENPEAQGKNIEIMTPDESADEKIDEIAGETLGEAIGEIASETPGEALSEIANETPDETLSEIANETPDEALGEIVIDGKKEDTQAKIGCVFEQEKEGQFMQGLIVEVQGVENTQTMQAPVHSQELLPAGQPQKLEAQEAQDNLEIVQEQNSHKAFKSLEISVIKEISKRQTGEAAGNQAVSSGTESQRADCHSSPAIPVTQTDDQIVSGSLSRPSVYPRASGLGLRNSLYKTGSSDVPANAIWLKYVLQQIFPDSPISWNCSGRKYNFLAQVENLLIYLSPSNSKDFSIEKDIAKEMRKHGWQTIGLNPEDLAFPRRMEREIRQSLKAKKV